MNNLILNISEVSTLLNMPIDTIRYYDKIGLVVPNKNVHNKYREYTLDNLLMLDYIKFLRELDIPIKHIQEMVAKNFSEQHNILQEHHKLLKSKMNFFKKLEQKLCDTLDTANQIENTLNTYSIIFYNDRYFKYLGTVGYLGRNPANQFKKKLLEEAKSTPDIIKYLYFTIDDDQLKREKCVDIMMNAFIEVTEDREYDLHIPPRYCINNTVKTSDMEFGKNYLNSLKWVASQNFIYQEPIILKFLDVSFYLLEPNETLIQLQIPYILKE